MVVVDIVLKLDDSDTDFTILLGVLVKDPLFGLALFELQFVAPEFADTEDVVVDERLTFLGLIPAC